jgi:hypothetical protein
MEEGKMNARWVDALTFEGPEDRFFVVHIKRQYQSKPWGFVTVEADNEEQAMRFVERHLSSEGYLVIQVDTFHEFKTQATALFSLG